MADLVTCQNVDLAGLGTDFGFFQTLKGRTDWGFFSDAQGQVTHKSLPNFEPIRDFMSVLVACKNEEDPSENEGTRVVTTFLPV